MTNINIEKENVIGILAIAETVISTAIATKEGGAFYALPILCAFCSVLWIITPYIEKWQENKKAARKAAKEAKENLIQEVENRINESRARGIESAYLFIQSMTPEKAIENAKFRVILAREYCNQVERKEKKFAAAKKAAKEAALKDAIVARVRKDFRPLDELKKAEAEIANRRADKLGVYEDVDVYFAEMIAVKGERRMLYFPWKGRKINGVKWPHYYLPTWAAKVVVKEWEERYCH